MKIWRIITVLIIPVLSLASAIYPLPAHAADDPTSQSIPGVKLQLVLSVDEFDPVAPKGTI